MNFQASEFLTIRTLIIRNKVLNTILASAITRPNAPITLGTALIKLEGKLRVIEREKRTSNTSLPRYVMANIVVSLGKTFSIGYTYNNSPIIWVEHVNRNGETYIACLKNFTKYVCEKFSFNATHADRIFSRIPSSLTVLLESEHVSAHFWRTGITKKPAKIAAKISERELEKYRSNLMTRLNDWRSFNIMLISIIKNRIFSLDCPAVGNLTLSRPLHDGMFYITFKSYIEEKQLSSIVHCDDLNPASWDKLNCEIDIFTLRKVFMHKD